MCLDEHCWEASLANESNKKCVKAQYDRSIHPCTFSKGDLVLFYDQDHDALGAGKFIPLWHGPYIVKWALKKVAYELSYYEGNKLAEPRNGIYLKKYYAWSFMPSSTFLYYMYIFSLKVCFCVFFLYIEWSIFSALLKNTLYFMWQMSTIPSNYIGYVDGASQYTWNIVFASWVIFSPTNELVGSRGIFLGPTTNNVADSSVIELLTEASTLGIHHLVVRLDS